MDKRQVSESGAWVQAMRPGTFRDFSGVERTFTPEDIASIAKGVQAQVGGSYMPPMVKGHPATDSPRVASIVDAKVGDKNILMLRVDKAEPKFAEEVRNGEYPYVSVALYKDYSKGIKHLGALGAAAPAIKGLEPVRLAEGGDDVICFASAFGYGLGYAINAIGRLFRRLREKLIEDSGIEAADDIYPDWDIRALEDFKPPEEDDRGGSEEFAESGGEEKNRGDELRQENETLRAEIEALKAGKARSEAEARKSAFAERMDNLQKAGKLGAGQRQQAEKILELAGCGTLSFAEGEHGEIEKALFEILESLPGVVKPGEFQFAENGGGSAGADISAKVQELVSSKGCTYAEAAKELTKGRQ